MGENLAPEPDSSILQGLTLGLVDRHSKSRSHWELPALPLKWIFCWLRDEGDSWNENNSTRTNNSALKEFLVDTLIKHQAGSIAQTHSWVNVAEKHDWHTRFEIQDVLGKSIRFQGMEILRVEPEAILRVL